MSTIVEIGSGQTAPALTTPTGSPASLTVESTTCALEIRRRRGLEGLVSRKRKELCFPDWVVNNDNVTGP